MNKRIKKKHRLKYWLRSSKEERQIFCEFLHMFGVKLTHEEIEEYIAQGIEDANDKGKRID